MGQNRRIPYGYQIQNGAITLHSEETEIVRRIYRDYVGGKSYKAIADMLTAEGIRYMPGKPEWNKNMVARILLNESYTGTQKYPIIVEEALYKAADTAKKPYTHTLEKVLKELKPLLVCGICGEQIQRRLKTGGNERWYCPSDIDHVDVSLTDQDIVQKVITLQQNLTTCKIEPPRRDKQISFELVRLQNEINRLLTDASESIASIQAKMMELAALRYTLCEDTTRIEECIIEELKAAPNELNPKSLAQLTERIQIIHTNITGVTLRNGFTIWKGETENE